MRKLILYENGSLEKIDLLVRPLIKPYSNLIMKQVHDAREGTVFSLDFDQIEAINASGTDEIIVQPLTWMKENIKKHDKFLVLENLSPPEKYDHAYNIGPVFEHAKLCVIEKKGSYFNYLGYLGGSREPLKKVLDLVYQYKKVTAKDIAVETEKHVNTTSTQLAQLYKMRLIRREEELLPEGGRAYIYKSLF